MSTIVAPGRTFNLTGYLRGTYYAQAGSAATPHGGVFTVSSYAINQALILLEATGTNSTTAGRGGGSLAVSGTLTNNDEIIADGGAAGVSLNDGVAGAQISVTGVLINNDLVVLTAAYQDAAQLGGYTGGGAVLTDSGTLTNNVNGLLTVLGSYAKYFGPNHPSAAPFSGATVVVSGFLGNAGDISIYGGDGTGHDREFYNGYEPGRGGQLRITSTGILINSAELTLFGGYGGRFPYYAAGGGTLQDLGRLTNYSSITVRAGTDEYQSYTYHSGGGGLISIGSTGLLTNDGQVSIDGAQYSGYGTYGASTSGTLINAGSLVNAGTIDLLAAAPRQVAAYYDALGPVLKSSGVLINTGSIFVAGAGAQGFTRGEGGTLLISGSLSNGGHITVGGGFYQAYPFYATGGYGGVFTDSGVVSNNGTILIGGAINGYSNSLLSPGGSFSITGTLTNNRMIEIQGGQTPAPVGKNGPFTAGGQFNDSHVLINNGTIKLDGGVALHDNSGTLAVTGTLFDPGTITGAGTLINQGTILSSTAKTGDIAATGFINDGVVRVTPGFALRVDSKVVTSLNDLGTFDLSSGSTLTLNNSVGISQSVSFFAGASTLDLGSVSSFSGVLAGLHPTSVIDFLHTNVTSASASGTTLTLTLGGGGKLALKLSAPLPATDGLKLSSDGNGGTDLLVTSTDVPLFAPGASDFLLAGHLQ